MKLLIPLFFLIFILEVSVFEAKSYSKNSISFKYLSNMTGIFSMFTSEKQIESNNDIPEYYYNRKESFIAMVEKVIDGDTYRVRHLPKGKYNKYQGKLTDHTIKVRIAAVDTPEIAKNGNKGQKFSEEAKQYAERKLLNQKVTIKILSKDQYGRVIGKVSYKNSYFFGIFSSTRDISEDLLSKGFATVYRQGGAQYDGSIDHWNALEEQAKRKTRGIWSESQPELPSTYKAQIRQSSNRI